MYTKLTMGFFRTNLILRCFLDKEQSPLTCTHTCTDTPHIHTSHLLLRCFLPVTSRETYTKFCRARKGCWFFCFLSSWSCLHLRTGIASVIRGGQSEDPKKSCGHKPCILQQEGLHAMHLPHIPVGCPRRRRSRERERESREKLIKLY